MKESIEIIFEQFVDFLMPELTPYESSLYLYLLRNSLFGNGTNQIRIGKRSIATGFCKSSRGKSVSYAQVSEMLESLKQKGCIEVGNTERLGTLYTIFIPNEIPLAAKKIFSELPTIGEEDYFTNPEKRSEIFDRDRWTCQYCGETISHQNATLDHFIPRSKGGDNTKNNLKACCLLCNGIKSGKTYEEAAPLLLKSIKERRSKSIN